MLEIFWNCFFAVWNWCLRNFKTLKILRKAEQKRYLRIAEFSSLIGQTVLFRKKVNTALVLYKFRRILIAYSRNLYFWEIFGKISAAVSISISLIPTLDSISVCNIIAFLVRSWSSAQRCQVSFNPNILLFRTLYIPMFKFNVVTIFFTFLQLDFASVMVLLSSLQKNLLNTSRAFSIQYSFGYPAQMPMKSFREIFLSSLRPLLYLF